MTNCNAIYLMRIRRYYKLETNYQEVTSMALIKQEVGVPESPAVAVSTAQGWGLSWWKEHGCFSFPPPKQHSPIYASPATSSPQIAPILSQPQSSRRTWQLNRTTAYSKHFRYKYSYFKNLYTTIRGKRKKKKVPRGTYPPDVSITSWNTIHRKISSWR